jgi:hypothetical protein
MRILRGKTAAAYRVAAIAFLVVAGAVVIHSCIYNWPIRFRPKWRFTPASLSPTHEAGTIPDHVVLTIPEDGRGAINITWRTAADVMDGAVQIAREEAGKDPRYVDYPAQTRELHSPELKANARTSCHTAQLRNLSPGASYRYRVGSRAHEAWSRYATFSLPPESGAGLAFVYFGDTQINPDLFGRLLEGADKRHPETAFYMIGGDMVDNGDYRNLWDDLLASSGTVFMRKAVVPCMGNHDFGHNGTYGPRIFTLYFGLPEQQTAHSVGNFSFRRGNAFFAVVNSLDVYKQREWLEQALSAAEKEGYDHKIVMFHLPVYNTKKGRNNADAQKYYVPLFDQYQVDLVLTGHDHSYLRTKPLRDGKPVRDGEFGTTYIIANACDKYYDHEPLAFAERQFANTATYQLVALGRDPDGRPTLRYSAHDAGGTVLDEFRTVK